MISANKDREDFYISHGGIIAVLFLFGEVSGSASLSVHLLERERESFFVRSLSLSLSLACSGEIALKCPHFRS